MEPLDLTKSPPRGPRVKIGGLVFLARVIDKLRADLPGGNVGRYLARIGQSQLFMSKLGIDINQLADVVRDAKTEDEVVQWVHAHSDPSTYESINELFSSRTQDDVRPETRDLFERNYTPEMRAKYHNLYDLLEADDAELFASK